MKAEDAGLEKCSSVAMCGSLVQGNASEVGSRQLVSNIDPDGPGLLAFLSEMLGFWQAFFFFPLDVIFSVICSSVANVS